MKLKPTNIYFILFFVILGFPLAVLIGRGFHVFSNPEIDTVSLTNLGFAIFIGLSSVLFSWSRSLDEKKHQYSVKQINKMAARSIMGSIFFILSSFFKYFALSKYVDIDRNQTIDLILEVVSVICILIALMMALLTIYDFFNVFISLWEKEYSKDADTPSTKELKTPK